MRPLVALAVAAAAASCAPVPVPPRTPAERADRAVERLKEVLEEYPAYHHSPSYPPTLAALLGFATERGKSIDTGAFSKLALDGQREFATVRYVVKYPEPTEGWFTVGDPDQW
jgi:hypothetical protein